MNRKILAILTLVVVIASVSAVSAFDLGDLFGAKQTATVGGIDFNIPEGFTEDEKLSFNETYENPGYFNYTVAGMTFVNSTGDQISIGVSESDVNATDESLASLPGNGENITINGINGYETTIDGLDGINYVKDGKIVFVTASDKELLKDVIIA